MIQTTTRTLALLTALLTVLAVNAKVGDEFNEKDANGNKLFFRVTSDATAMLVHKGKNYEDYTQVRVPETVNYKGAQLTVNEMEPLCFENSQVKTVALPGSITVLPQGAFMRCSMLQHIDFSSTLQEIGPQAFAYCKQLQEVSIPSTVQKIGPEAFFFCEKITTVSVPEGITELPTTPGKAVGVFMCCSMLQSVQLPSTLQTMGKGCFTNCWKLKEVRGLHEGIKMDGECFKGTAFNWDEYQQSFEYMVSNIIPKIREWQKKRDFESVEQYRTRVTPDGQARRVQDYLQEAIDKYTAAHPIKMELGQYDSEYQMFPIKSQYGTKYVKVPKGEVEAFRTLFAAGTHKAEFVMGNNFPQVSTITFTGQDKTYVTEATKLEEAHQDLLANLPEIQMGGQGGGATGTGRAPELDDNPPVNPNTNQNTFAVIIGNEHYLQVAGVPYAMNDANIFARYCEKTLGLPQSNIRLYKDATFGQMLSAVTDIKQVAQAYGGDLNVIFYYAGHGIPNETTRDAYLMPVDGSAQMTEVCYPLSRLYKELSELGARRVVCFMDACFSGSLRGEGMIASARGIVVKPKPAAPQGNMVVFSAAQGDETAYPFNEKGHGLFTYYLLKKLQDSHGDCQLGELADYLQTNVKRQASQVNKKPQTPTTQSANTDWQQMRLR